MATLTFLFTDLEGSTRLWEAHPDAMRSALAEHDETLTKAIVAHQGKVFKHTGDGILAVFTSAADAVHAAAEAQRTIADRPHADVGVLKVRMAINTGDAEQRGDDYFGSALNRAARLLAAGHGGQILVGFVTERLLGNQLSDGLRMVDLGEHRLRDLAQPERVYQLAGLALPAEFPSLRSLDVVPNNLPSLTTSFVGRDQELAEVDKLLRGSRLVTLTGVGGAGKTRLALQVAALQGSEYADGMWFIQLAPVTEPDQVVAAAAGVLGVTEDTDRPLIESLVDHVSGKELLLIVDNCEHVITASARMVDTILTGSTDVRIITTSRELLGIGGEVAYGMRSMAIPEGEGAPVDELLRYDAIRLFVERAVASKPDFRLKAENADAVAEICRRLDGMPLALELAAARLRSFSPQQIADHLDQRFRLLTGGSRTALPRQQTLAAAIDWSYQLLNETERLLFERLSVFQGGFSLQAAEQVCSDEIIDSFDVLELIPSLVDKSLVSADTGSADVRYRLLETIRQFARDRLDDSGRADEAREKHARFFLELAEAAEPNVRGADEQLWWGRINADLDNLRQAVTWSVEAGNREIGLRIAGAIWRFWWFTFRFGQGIKWLRDALEGVREEMPLWVVAKARLGLGTLLTFQGTSAEAEQNLRESLKLYRELDDQGASPDVLRHGFSAALINLSAQIEISGDEDGALELNREALEISTRLHDLAGIAVSLGNIAEGYGRRGHNDEAREWFQRSIEASMKLN